MLVNSPPSFSSSPSLSLPLFKVLSSSFSLYPRFLTTSPSCSVFSKVCWMIFVSMLAVSIALVSASLCWTCCTHLLTLSLYLTMVRQTTPTSYSAPELIGNLDYLQCVLSSPRTLWPSSKVDIPYWIRCCIINLFQITR